MKILIAASFTLLFAFSAFAQKQAEVIVTSTYIRKAPDQTSEKVHTVEKGEKLVLEKSRDTNGWYNVSLQNGAIKGWIRKDTVTISSVKEEKPTAPKTETAVVKPTPKPIPTPKPTPQKPTPTPKPSPTTTTATVIPTPTENTAPKAEPTPAVIPTPTPDPNAIEEDNESLLIETEEVSLSVRVVDANNRPVGKLNQTDFKVFEDDVLQPITSLTTEEVPVISSLVIDNSRSLRTQLGKIIEAGKIIVGKNKDGDQSAIVRFVSKDKIEVVQDFTPDKQQLNNALDNLFVEGGQTAIIDAVYLTAKMVEQFQNSQKKEDVKLRALVLVSDGDDRSSTYQEKQLFELLRNSFVQIYAIGFVNDLSKTNDTADGISRQEKAKSFLTRLAQETGGKVYFPNSIDELSAIATEISGELRTQYLISYAPTNSTRDGSFRRIKVSIADGANQQKRNAITRTGRNAPK